MDTEFKKKILNRTGHSEIWDDKYKKKVIGKTILRV